MRFVKITIFAVAGRLVALAIAKLIPNRKADGIAIPLARHSSFPNSNKTDLDAISSHGVTVREKILRGLGNYEINTGKKHPLVVKRSESGLAQRGTNLPLGTYQNDYWMGEISIGTPPKTLNVQIDTGSPDTWVLQTGCAGISGDRNLWDPHSSESSKKQGKSFKLKYADGSIVEGDQYIDNVTIAGFTADPQTFGSVTSYTSHNNKQYFVDGLLGLAFPSVSEFGTNPLLKSLVSQHGLISQRFSLKLSSSGAEMYIGGENSMLYKGDIAYTRVTVPGLWQVSIDDVRGNGNKILLNVPAIVDTGTNWIFGDWERVSELYARLDGTLVEHLSYGFYYLPCNSFPTVSFTFGGRTFEIPPEVLKLEQVEEGSPDCFSAIIGHRPITYWLIGNTYLQGVYSVFDFSTSEVGFAHLA